MKQGPRIAVLLAGFTLALHPSAKPAQAITGHESQDKGTDTDLRDTASNPTPPVSTGQSAPARRRLPADGNLPEAASAFPLLSAIAAGVLLGGLASARRTRPKSK